MNAAAFLLAPFYLISSKVEHIYQFVTQANLLGKNFQFMNFGYWVGHCDYDTAAKNLAYKLSEFAKVRPFEKVLCVGCGYGDEVALWQEKYQLQSCIGINLYFEHLPKEHKPQSYISFCQADAVSLPFLSGSFDKVLALESALHFNLRENFFAEANRVLKPGGTLALADIILQDKKLSFWQKGWVHLASIITKVPNKNHYTTQSYQQKLAHSGFQAIKIENANKRVLTGFMSYLSKKAKKEKIKLPFGLTLLYMMFGKKFPICYILAKGKKA